MIGHMTYFGKILFLALFGPICGPEVAQKNFFGIGLFLMTFSTKYFFFVSQNSNSGPSYGEKTEKSTFRSLFGPLILRICKKFAEHFKA